jgi:hypothetical protein
MNEPAKLILSAYRPHGQDADDPTFADALAAAGQDATLADWLREQQEFDRAIADRLAQVAPPPGLRERIIAGAKVSRTREWWQWPQVWAVAAMFLILVVFGERLAPPHHRELADWQTHALGVLDELEAGRTGFNKSAKNSAELTAWLREHAAPTPAVPSKLTATETWGCKTWTWQGRQVSLMCFKAGEKGVHLFTTDRAGLADSPPEGKPEFARHGEWVVASWSQGDKTHMLAGLEGEAMLRGFLASHAVPKMFGAVLLP